MTDKQSLIFFCSFTAITFSMLGWFCISLLSPNEHIWFISVPMMIFIAIVEIYLMVETLYKEKQNDR